MKNIFIAAVVLFFFAPVLAQKKMTDREFDGFKGAVKSVIIEEAEVVKNKGKEIEKPREIKEERYYDKNGNIIKTLNNAVGELRIYTFIDGDKTYKITETQSSIIPAMTIEGVYDSENPNIKEKQEGKERVADDRYDFKSKYKYDAQGRIIKEHVHFNTGVEARMLDYSYDDKGRMIKVVNYNAGKPTYIETYKFDDKGVELESIFDSKGVGDKSDFHISKYSDYRFDTQGNWIKRTQLYTYKNQGKTITDKTICYRKITYHQN